MLAKIRDGERGVLDHVVQPRGLHRMVDMDGAAPRPHHYGAPLGTGCDALDVIEVGEAALIPLSRVLDRRQCLRVGTRYHRFVFLTAVVLTEASLAAASPASRSSRSAFTSAAQRSTRARGR